MKKVKAPNGREYPVKKHEGFTFAPESLWMDNSHLDGINEADKDIALYFPDDEFRDSSPKELFDYYVRWKSTRR